MMKPQLNCFVGNAENYSSCKWTENTRSQTNPPSAFAEVEDIIKLDTFALFASILFLKDQSFLEM